MGKRSNMLVAVGLVVFLLGGAIVLLVLRNADDDGAPVAASSTTPSADVVVATEDLPAGTSGSQLIGQNLVRTQSVGANAAPDAVRSPGELVGRVLALPVKKGEVVRVSGLRAETIKIPEGKEAVAVQVDFIAGVAGQVGPGDRINLYTNLGGGPAGAYTRLVLGNVEVLKVSEAPPPATAAAATSAQPNALTAPVASSGTPLVFLVAVDQAQAEKLIFSAVNHRLYGSLVTPEAQPQATPGRTAANLFEG